MPHLIAGLTAQDASLICMDQCRAMCCRGPLILRLEKDEVASFERSAERLGVGLIVTPAPDGSRMVRFSDHPGERCPMLDDATSACRVYEDRPKRCRDFPEKDIPGCAISGG